MVGSVLVVNLQLRLMDVELAIDEARQFRSAGGGAIVDVTPIGIGRDPLALRAIAALTGLHVTLASSEVVFHGDGLVRHRRAEGDQPSVRGRGALPGGPPLGPFEPELRAAGQRERPVAVDVRLPHPGHE